MNEFQKMYKSLYMDDQEFYKSEALTDKELVDIRRYIKALQNQGATSKIIIKHLQNFNKKIEEVWKAERVYYTTIKQIDTKIVADAGKELEVTKYRVVLSPNACEICKKKTNYGKKIFNNADVHKTGYGETIPWHPNCYCVLLPIN